MKYAIQVSGGRVESCSAKIGYQFSRALLLGGHQIIRVFFHGEGVRYAFADQPELPGDKLQTWSSLANEFGVELVYCSTAAELRGLGRSDSTGSAALEGFKPGGLGLWVDACILADRVVGLAA